MTRRNKTEEDYPLAIETPCPFCKQMVVSTRTGSGKPWRGGLDYWYSNRHHEVCPNDAERQAACAATKKLNDWATGR